jgi:hypothetical protein
MWRSRTSLTRRSCGLDEQRPPISRTQGTRLEQIEKFDSNRFESVRIQPRFLVEPGNNGQKSAKSNRRLSTPSDFRRKNER